MAGLGHHVRDGPALPAQVLGTPEGTEPDVRPARRARVRRATGRELGTDAVARGPVRETFLERSGSAGLDPLRELDEQPRRRPLRGVGVERDVEPFGTRVVDQREHRLGRAGVCLAVVEVRDVGRRLGPPADLDRLAERVEVAVAERVANVGVVEAAVPAGLLGEHGELLGRRVPAGRVIEPGAEPERAIGHRVGEHAAHPGEGRGIGRDVVPAQGGDPELRIPDEGRDVEADRAVVAVEVARDRGPVVVDRRPAIETAVELDERLEVLAGVSNGANPLPSTPTSSVVTPWRTFGSCRPSARIIRPPWLCRSMNPGATTLPVASIRWPTFSGGGSVASRRRSRPSTTAMVPGRPGAPVPSTTVPPLIRRSACSVTCRPPFRGRPSTFRAYPDLSGRPTSLARRLPVVGSRLDARRSPAPALAPPRADRPHPDPRAHRRHRPALSRAVDDLLPGRMGLDRVQRRPIDFIRPVNEHWSTIPLLLYRATFAVVGLHSYLPYIAEVIALHLVASRRPSCSSGGAGDGSSRRSRASRCSSSAVGRRTCSGRSRSAFVGSVAFGLWGLVALERSGRALRRRRRAPPAPVVDVVGDRALLPGRRPSAARCSIPRFGRGRSPSSRPPSSTPSGTWSSAGTPSRDRVTSPASGAILEFVARGIGYSVGQFSGLSALPRAACSPWQRSASRVSRRRVAVLRSQRPPALAPGACSPSWPCTSSSAWSAPSFPRTSRPAAAMSTWRPSSSFSPLPTGCRCSVTGRVTGRARGSSSRVRSPLP